MTDDTIALLRKIEAVSVSIGLQSGWLVTDVNYLVNRPAWETKAEAELEEAEQNLRRALSVIQQARALYQRKQVMAS